MTRQTFEKYIKRVAKRNEMTAIILGVWFLILNSNCSNNYHHNYYTMGRKLEYCFGIDYKTAKHKNIVVSTVLTILKENKTKKELEYYHRMYMLLAYDNFCSKNKNK